MFILQLVLEQRVKTHKRFKILLFLLYNTNTKKNTNSLTTFEKFGVEYENGQSTQTF